jgi:beta-lactam-binding protein with PASTA domain/tRNA A-37 threonylcarbamoyl transferase component Bud32
MIGRLIDGRYQIKSRIARGGMATVYLATDLRLERRVAVKVMHGHLADDSAFKARFVQEAKSAARLAHPNVVNVFDQGQDAEMAYLVMEYLPGITLRDLLKDYGRLTPEQTVDIMDAVLRGLAAAHDAGIVHRDVKPENVLLADDGRIKLGDFGLARATTANTASGQALLGTIAYLSPELLTRGVADARSDIYATGIMMYEMLTGEQPFKGEQPMQVAYQHANDKVPAPSTLNPEVPAELDAIVAWATVRSPDGRPATAGVLLESLLDAEKGIRSGAPFEGLSTQQTMVMPAEALVSFDDETQRLGTGALTGLNPISAVENPVGALTEVAQRRRTRGWWALILVVLLAGLGAGTGWYFSAGPGSTRAVPAIAGLTPEAATAALAAEGFKLGTTERNDATVPVGTIISSEPAAGTQAPIGSSVMGFVSTGPRYFDTPTFAGKPVAEATTTATRMGFTVGEPHKQFAKDVPVDVVIAALGADGQPLPAKYVEGGTITFVVSLGPIPSVVGQAQADAEHALTAAGLVPVVAGNEFSDTVAKGVVISQSAPEGVVTAGAKISLVISKGQDLVEVPNVVGRTISDAAKALEAQGFGYKSNAPVAYWSQLPVLSQSQPAGSKIKRGSTIDINNP